MKRYIRILGVFFCLFLVLTGTAYAASQPAIDVSNMSEGYFSVHYEESTPRKMKVGVTHDGKTTYYNYTVGTTASYALSGDGEYTITLYRNVSGTSYTTVERRSVKVALSDPLAPYLASTAEISFADGDSVTAAAASLCEGLTNEADKLVAIHNYIAGNFQYDYAFAANVTNGSIVNYTPDTAAVLEAKKGVCYDFSALFAAMCRSQGIPCAVAKGVMDNGYHAWNLAYVNGGWVALDLTASVCLRLAPAAELSACTAAGDAYYSVSF